MSKSPLLILLFPTLLFITSCALRLDANEDFGPQYEALTWLESNPNPYALAGNRFYSTKDAIAFVEMLYEVGAMEVLVTSIYDEDWRIKAEGGPYADTLIIRLPHDSEKRNGLFKIVNEEAAREGFSPEIDIGQETLLLWWD
jgi:hypothetical protein